MISSQEKTAVIVIGGGVSGLALATFLQLSGVACVVLESRERAYVEVRQRAGVVEAQGVRMFERWGLADRLLGGPVAHTIDYRIDGTSRILEVAGDDGSPGRFCTQQMLVNSLMRALIDVMGGDVRFGVDGIAIRNDGDSVQVAYNDARGAHLLDGDYIVGCDGNRGVSRASIPHGVLTTTSHEYGHAWLAALVEAPVAGHPVMGVSDHGFVAQLPRGPQRSRYYLQCALSDTPEDWSDDRLWDEIRLRMGDAAIRNVAVHDKDIIALRSVVHAPMQHRRLFLAGDAAHLVPPTGAKGMNLALRDVDVLAHALVAAVRDGDSAALDGYSDTRLPDIWKYQEFSAWMTETMHDAGDPTGRGAFRRKVARARLEALFDTPAARRLHGEFQRGTA